MWRKDFIFSDMKIGLVRFFDISIYVWSGTEEWIIDNVFIEVNVWSVIFIIIEIMEESWSKWFDNDEFYLPFRIFFVIYLCQFQDIELNHEGKFLTSYFFVFDLHRHKKYKTETVTKRIANHTKYVPVNFPTQVRNNCSNWRNTKQQN